MPAQESKKKILIGPDEGTHLPILDITHKVTAESFGGALRASRDTLPPAT